MKQQLRNYIFVALLTLVGLINILVPDQEASLSERRLLAQWESISFENFESYFLDQFMFRDQLRTIKSVVDFYVFQKKDIHEVYIDEGHAFQLQKPLDHISIQRFSTYAQNLAKLMPENSSFVVAVIPDKSYYYPKKGYPNFDYLTMIDLLEDNLLPTNERPITFLDLSLSLNLDDYYTTDLHWKQESLSEVRTKLLELLSPSHDLQKEAPALAEKEVITYSDFYGGYFSRAPLFLSKETLTYYTTHLTQSSTVSIYESIDTPNLYEGVYNPSALGQMDSYDVFLYGPKSVITIDTHQSLGRHLIIFRDSFASSLAPLLLDYYDTLTLIDLRYISPTLALKMVGPISEPTDVLMLYNSQIINNSLLLKPM
jgi:hypothetical protein